MTKRTKVNFQECEHRMTAIGVSATEKERYRSILRKLSEKLEKPNVLNIILADRLKYIAFSTSGGEMCLTQSSYWKAALGGHTFTCFHVPLNQTDNIFSLDRICGGPYRENVKQIGSMVVYQPASPDSDPRLDIRTVALQVPTCLAEKVDSFCLCLKEDEYAIHAYNYILGAYEFEIVLFGSYE